MPKLLLAEGISGLIIDHITTNIDAALAVVDAARTDSAVGLEPPRTILNFPKAKLYETPAILVIVEDIVFQNDAGPNFVKSISRTIVSTVCEERKADLLNLKIWRYQSALFDLLAQRQLVDTVNNIKLFIVPKEINYSELYTKDDPESGEMTFRKEAIFELEVNHVENF